MYRQCTAPTIVVCFIPVLGIMCFCNLQWLMDKHSYTEWFSACLKLWALETSFAAHRFRAQSGWCEITGLEWPMGGLWLWGVKGAQKAADLSAVHIICLYSLTHCLQQEQPWVFMVSRSTSLNWNTGCPGNQQGVHLPPNSPSLTLVEDGLLSS